MPPKKAPQQPSKKADAKKKDKIIEDKTFGLKNKKGAKQQRFIQQVEKQVKFGNNPKKVSYRLMSKKQFDQLVSNCYHCLHRTRSGRRSRC